MNDQRGSEKVKQKRNDEPMPWKIPAQLLARMARFLKIPTIGIETGPRYGGQVLIASDTPAITEDESN